MIFRDSIDYLSRQTARERGLPLDRATRITKIGLAIALTAAAVAIGIGAFGAFALSFNRSIGLLLIVIGTSVIGTFWLAPTGALDTTLVKSVLWVLVGTGFLAAIVESFVLVAGVTIGLFLTLIVLAVIYRGGAARK